MKISQILKRGGETRRGSLKNKTLQSIQTLEEKIPIIYSEGFYTEQMDLWELVLMKEMSVILLKP
jgi:hypothetical protein